MWCGLKDTFKMSVYSKENEYTIPISFLLATDSGDHPAPCLMGTRAPFLKVKYMKHETDQSSATLNNEWSNTSNPPYIFVAWYKNTPLSHLHLNLEGFLNQKFIQISCFPYTFCIIIDILLSKIIFLRDVLIFWYKAI
jgi:hypothetical protein